MNWTGAVNSKLFETRAEQELKMFLAKALPDFKAPRNPKKWNRAAARLRKLALDRVFLRGYTRSAVDTPPRVVWGDVLHPDPSYRIRKLRYEAYPGYWIPALLYEPIGIRGPLPVGVMYMGHGIIGKAGCQIHCVNMVRRGMLAMTPEFIGMGELSGDIYHSRQAHLAMTGLAGTGLMYLALKKGLDVVLAHRQADRRRVAVTGCSGGGWQAIVIAALDPRVTLCVPVAGYTSMQARLGVVEDIGDLEQVPVDMATVLDYQDMTAMVAPRPLLQILNENDDCCFATVRAKPVIVDAIRPVYRAFGAEDRLEFYNNIVPGTHNYEAASRGQFYRFLNKHFRLSTPEEDIHRSEDILPSHQLDMGLPAEQESFLSLARKRAYALCAGRVQVQTATERAKLRHSIKEVIRLPLYRAVDRVLCRRGDQHQHALRMGEWTVPMTAFTPQGDLEVELWLADSGRAHFTVPPDGKRKVYAADIFDTGENQYSVARKMMLEGAGHRLLGIQVAQILALADWASRQSVSGRVHVVASGYVISTATLIAAALRPERFSRLSLNNILGSLKSLIDWAEKYEQRQSLFCFGILEVCDLPDLQPLLGEIEVTTDRTLWIR